MTYSERLRGDMQEASECLPLYALPGVVRNQHPRSATSRTHGDSAIRFPIDGHDIGVPYQRSPGSDWTPLPLDGHFTVVDRPRSCLATRVW